MPRQKRTCRILEKAEIRAAGLKAIAPTLDFGGTRNVNNMTQLMEQLRNKIDAYNTALSVIDSYQTEIEELEKTLGNLCEEMLIGVAFQYGKDSREYQMAGGVRKSDRIRRNKASRSKTGAEELSKENAQTV
jgi:HAMP domain-containing protein